MSGNALRKPVRVQLGEYVIQKLWIQDVIRQIRRPPWRDLSGRSVVVAMAEIGRERKETVVASFRGTANLQDGSAFAGPEHVRQARSVEAGDDPTAGSEFYLL